MLTIERSLVGPDALTIFLVARLVGKAEIDKPPVAKASMQKALDRLRSRFAWDDNNPPEWAEVRAEA